MKANRDELARAFAPLLRALRAKSPTRAQLLLGAVATSVIAGAIVHWFLEPGFPGTPGSDAFALGMLLGFGVIIANTVLTWRTYMRRRLPDVPAAGSYSPDRSPCRSCASRSRAWRTSFPG